MQKLFAMTAIVALALLPSVTLAAQGGAASLAGAAKIDSPGIKFLPCSGSSCPGFSWHAGFTPAFEAGGASGWNDVRGTLVAASCGGNIHQSMMTVGGKLVDYTGVCVGLLCSGGGPWGGAGAFNADLVFTVAFNEAAQCLNGVVGTGDGFKSATFNGAASGATSN